jgi:hypothetical protein
METTFAAFATAWQHQLLWCGMVVQKETLERVRSSTATAITAGESNSYC